jgi:putative ABC transport system permease protein
MLTAVDPARELSVCTLRTNGMTRGHFLSKDQPHGTVLAGELVRRLALPDGGLLAVVAPDRDGSLNAVELPLVGVAGLPGAPGLDAKLGYLPLASAQELLRMEGRATEVVVGVADMGEVDVVQQRLQAALGPDYEVITWRQAVPPLADAILYQNVVFSIVSTIFLIVALVGIANTMLMSVLERTREIGVMMSVGLRRSGILALFLAESAILGLLGAVPGSLAATLVAKALNTWGIQLTGIGGGPVVIRPHVSLVEVVFALVICVVGTIVAALGPAWRGSRLRPVEALTHV